MAATKLTARFVESVKPTLGRQTAYPDVQVPGLELRVSGEGRKAWSMRYRTLEGQQRRVSLGTFPAVDLADVRAAGLRILADVAGGSDPAASRRKAKTASKAETLRTFNHLADAYLRACETGEWKPKNRRKRTRSIEDDRGILRRHARPVLGGVPLDEIDRAMVRKLLRAMVAKGIGAQTNRTHATIRQCFAFAIDAERLTVNPAAGLPPQAEEAPRARTLTDAELRTVWEGLNDPGRLRLPDGVRVYIGRPLAIILQLAVLLLQRRSEVAGMRVAELNLDQATWLIPAERMKNVAPHLVPLPPRAVELIREAIRRAPPSPVVFPSARDTAEPVRSDSVTRALAKLYGATGIKGATVHDLRRTGSTILTSERLGVSPFIRSKVLGHRGDTGGGSSVSAVHYDANEYVAEKRRALEAWAGLLIEIVGERPADLNVVQLREARR